MAAGNRNSRNKLTSSQSLSGKATLGDLRWIPAQLTRIWILPPITSSAFWKTCLTACKSSRSQYTTSAVPPRALMEFNVVRLGGASFGGLRWIRQMDAPACASAMAHAAPMPGNMKQVRIEDVNRAKRGRRHDKHRSGKYRPYIPRVPPVMRAFCP